MVRRRCGCGTGWTGSGTTRTSPTGTRVTGAPVCRRRSWPPSVCCSSCSAYRTGRPPRRSAAASTSSTRWQWNWTIPGSTTACRPTSAAVSPKATVLTASSTSRWPASRRPDWCASAPRSAPTPPTSWPRCATWPGRAVDQRVVERLIRAVQGLGQPPVRADHPGLGHSVLQLQPGRAQHDALRIRGVPADRLDHLPRSPVSQAPSSPPPPGREAHGHLNVPYHAKDGAASPGPGMVHVWSIPLPTTASP